MWKPQRTNNLRSVPLGEHGQRAAEPIAGKHQRLSGDDRGGHAGTLI